mgnify:CR=1 FL=1
MQTTFRLLLGGHRMQLTVRQRRKNLAYGCLAFDWYILWPQMVVATNCQGTCQANANAISQPEGLVRAEVESK